MCHSVQTLVPISLFSVFLLVNPIGVIAMGLSDNDVHEAKPSLERQDSRTAGVDSRFCCNICLEAVVDPVTTLCGHLYCWPCLFRWLEPGMELQERSYLGIRRSVFPVDQNRRVCPVCKAPCSALNLVPIYVRDCQEETERKKPPSSTASTSIDGSTNYPNERRNGMGEGSNHDEQEAGGGTLFNETQSLGQNSSSQHDENFDLGVSEGLSGLRQRLRFRSRDSENSGDTLPSRPATNSPTAQSRTSPPPDYMPPTPQRYHSMLTPITPTGHRGSLTHALLLSFQQSIPSNSGVPPLHRREGIHSPEFDAYPAGTEYLTRLLIMFASFVVLCLLLL